MKKIILAIYAMLFLGAATAGAVDPRDILRGISSKSDSTGQNSGLGAIGNIIGNLTSNNKFTVDNLVGSWTYTGPAVSFASDNALKNIGGAAAATAVETKLEPYYKRLGFTRTTLTVNEDHSFEMKMGVIQFKGTIEKTDDGNLKFNFSALGRNLGAVAAHATKSGNTLNITFDSTKMVKMLTTVSSKLNISTLKTLSSFLNAYDGIYMGYKMTKTK
jgi:hypothetical protein